MSDPDAGVPREQVRLAKEEAAAWESCGEAVHGNASPLKRRAAFGSALKATEALRQFEQAMRPKPEKAAA